MKNSVKILSILAIVLSFFASIFTAANTFLHPLHRSPADYAWAGFYLFTLGGAVGLWWFGRHRLLFRLAVGAVGALLVLALVFSGSGPAVLALFWLVILAAALGKKVLDWLGLPLLAQRPVEGLILSTGMGMIALTLITLALASVSLLQPYLPLPQRLFHLLHPVPVFGALILLSAVFIPGFWKAVRPLATPARGYLAKLWNGDGSGGAALALALAVICGAAGLLLALAPSIRFDALTYHLTAPARFIEARGMVPIPEIWNTYWAHYAEIIYTLAMIVAGQPLPALLHYAFGILTTGLVFILGKRLGGTPVGMAAALLFFSVPVVSYEAGTAYIDLFHTFFIVAAVCCVVNWWQDQSDSWLAAGGIMTGFALGVKVSIATILIPLGFLLALLLWTCTRSPRRVVGGLLGFGLPALLLFAPWPLRDYAWTGNPIFPMYNSFFQSTTWYGDNAMMFSLNARRWTNLLNLLLLPLDLVINTRKYYWEAQNGMLAALPLLSLPWLYSWHPAISKPVRRMAWMLAALVAFSLILFFFTSPNARYMLPLFALMAVLAALNLQALLIGLNNFKGQKLAAAGAVALALVYLLSTRLALTVRSLDIEERYPVQVALGLEKPEQFLSRSLPAYDTFQYLDGQSQGDLNVLALGTDFSYYTRAKVFPYQYSKQANALANLDQPAGQYAQTLVESGFDYVLVDWNGVQKNNYWGLPLLRDSFLRQYTRLEYAHSNIYAYRITPGGRSQAAVPAEGQNLLADSGFEERQSGIWEVFGAPLFEPGSAQAHGGNAAVQVSGSDFIFQQVAVTPGRLYTLGYWMRADAPEQQARLQIMWRDRNMLTVAVASFAIQPGSEWTWRQLSDVAPKEAAYARVYVTAEEGSRFWADDVIFARGSITD